MTAALSSSLSIFIITYNRSPFLAETLSNLVESPFSRCSITVLDNCSTDDTESMIATRFLDHDTISYQKNVCNIGASGNAILPFLRSETPYTWVLCDDDYFDFSDIRDLEEALAAESATLVMVGGHKEARRHGAGLTGTPRQLMDDGVGVNFYRDTSFLPSTIYRTSFARAHIAECYAYCSFNYPHMALALAATFTNEPVYVSRNRLVTPSIGTQSYTQAAQLDWWYGLSRTIRDLEDRRCFMTSQWRAANDPSGLYRLLNTAIRLKRPDLALKIVGLFKFRILTSITSLSGWRSRGRGHA